MCFPISPPSLLLGGGGEGVSMQAVGPCCIVLDRITPNSGDSSNVFKAFFAVLDDSPLHADNLGEKSC